MKRLSSASMEIMGRAPAEIMRRDAASLEAAARPLTSIPSDYRRTADEFRAVFQDLAAEKLKLIPRPSSGDHELSIAWHRSGARALRFYIDDIRACIIWSHPELMTAYERDAIGELLHVKPDTLVIAGLPKAPGPIEKARALLVAIDALPVGKDIRGRLGNHIRELIDLLDGEAPPCC